MHKNEKAKLLLEQLGDLLSPPETSNDKPDETRAMLSIVLSRLDDVTNRLDGIESELHQRRDGESNDAFSVLSHPSLQTFDLPEAAQFLPGTKIKACTFEPNGKPCDECALCNSRGF